MARSRPGRWGLATSVYCFALTCLALTGCALSPAEPPAPRWDGVFARDGYGVYDGPIAELAVSYGFSGTTHAQGVDPEQLYDAVRQGYPSVVWMPNGLTVKGRGAWSTPKGKHIDYVVTEHAVVLAGVDARGVVYADPYTASLEHASFGAFEAAMAELGDRAVTVRP